MSVLLNPFRFGGGEALRNLLTYTEDFSNAVWTKQGTTTVTVDQVVDPNSEMTADLVEGDGSNGLFQTGITVDGGSNNTKSIYLRGVSGGETVILKDPWATIGTTTCNLTTSWQRFTLTETQTGGTAGLWVDDIPAGGIYAWGAQLEQADAATAYQKVVA